MKTLLGILIILLGISLGYLFSVGIIWTMFFVIGKIGYSIELSVWWSGLLLYLLWLLFGKK